MKKLLLTGSSGFLGLHLLSNLSEKSIYEVIPIVRKQDFKIYNSVSMGELDAETDWSSALEKVDCVIHLAGRAHVMNESYKDSRLEYFKNNVDVTLNLAKQCIAAGVKRFIFVSTIKVNGESTDIGDAFSSFDMPVPNGHYAESKFSAEKGLLKLSEESGLEVVIIRPTLIYGSLVKGNFAAMMNIASKNLPLPLGAIHNKRSLVAIDNLVDLIITCIDHPNAANQTFLVSDDEDVSTTELLTYMTLAAGKKPRLLPVPVSVLKFVAKLFRKEAVIDRLCGNLQVDITHTKETLGWKPVISVEDAIKKCFVKG